MAVTVDDVQKLGKKLGPKKEQSDDLTRVKQLGNLLSIKQRTPANQRLMQSANRFMQDVDMSLESGDLLPYPEVAPKPTEDEAPDVSWEQAASDAYRMEHPRDRSFTGNLKEAWTRGMQGIMTDIAAYEAIFEGEGDFGEIREKNKALQAKRRLDPVEANVFSGPNQPEWAREAGNWIVNAAYGAAGILPGMAKGISEAGEEMAAGAATGAGAAAVAGQAGPQVAAPEEVVTVPGGAAIGAKAGLTVGSAEFWWRQGAGQMALEMADRGIDVQENQWAKTAAGLGAIPYAAIEFAQVSQLAPGVKSGAKKVIRQSLGRTLTRAIGRYGATWGAEVSEEVAQEAVMQATEDVAAWMDNKDVKYDKEGLKQKANRLWSTFKEAGHSMALLPVPGTAVQSAAQIRDATGLDEKPAQAAEQDVQAEGETRWQRAKSELQRQISVRGRSNLEDITAEIAESHNVPQTALRRVADMERKARPSLESLVKAEQRVSGAEEAQPSSKPSVSPAVRKAAQEAGLEKTELEALREEGGSGKNEALTKADVVSYAEEFGTPEELEPYVEEIEEAEAEEGGVEQAGRERRLELIRQRRKELEEEGAIEEERETEEAVERAKERQEQRAPEDVAVPTRGKGVQSIASLAEGYKQQGLNLTQAWNEAQFDSQKPLDWKLFKNAYEQAEEPEGGTAAFPEGAGGVPELEDVQAGQVNPVSRHEIISNLEDSLGDVTFRIGGFNRPSAAGIYRPHEQLIRTKKANDLETSAHEVGHHLYETLDWGDTESLPAGAAGELVRLGKHLYPSYEGDQAMKEGAAEFTRMWMFNPDEAAQLAPNFYSKFETDLGANDRVRQAMQRAQAQIEQYRKQGAHARTSSQIVSTREAEEMRRGGVKERVTRFFRNQIEQWLDPYTWLLNFERDMEGARVPTESPYAMARVTEHNMGDAKEWIFGQGQWAWGDWGQGSIGPSLQEVIQPVAGRLNELSKFLISRQTLAGYETGQAAADAQKIVDDLGNDQEVKQASNRLVEYCYNLTKYGEDAGLLRPGTAEEWAAKNPTYAPLARALTFIESAADADQGSVKQTIVDSFKKRTGSTRPIIDPIETIAKMTYGITRAAWANGAKRAAIRLARNTEGSGNWISNIDKPLKPINVGVEEALKALSDRGVVVEDVDPELLTQAFQIFRPSMFAPKGATGVWEAGELNFYEMNPDLLRAMEKIGGRGAPTFLRMLRHTTGVVKRAFQNTIVMTVDFAVRNALMRDLFQGFVTNDFPVLLGYDNVRGLASAVGRTDVYHKWIRAGGHDYRGWDPEDIHRTPDVLIERITKGDQGRTRQVLDTFKNPRHFIKTLVTAPGRAVNKWSEVIGMSETAGRMAQFRAAYRGLKRQHPDWGEKNLTVGAVREASEANVPFGRIGDIGRYLNEMIPFFNPSVQGTAVLLRRMTGAPNIADFKEGKADRSRKLKNIFSFYGKLGLLTAITGALYMRNRDDPEYWELTERERDLNWWVKLAESENGGTWLKIAKPWEVGMLGATIPERFMRWVDQNDPEAFDELGSAMSELVFPGFAPKIVQPIIEDWANRDMFWDTPIVPPWKEDLEPFLQTKKSNTEISRLIGERLNWSPAIIEHYVRGYGGSIGIGALRMLDYTMQQMKLLPQGPEPPMTPDQWPVVGKFLRRGLSYTKSMQQFYDQADESETSYRSYQELLKQDPERARQYLQSHKEEVGRYKRDRAIRKVLSAYRNQMDKIFASEDMGRREKIRKSRELQKRMVNMARKAVGKPPIE